MPSSEQMWPAMAKPGTSCQSRNGEKNYRRKKNYKFLRNCIYIFNLKNASHVMKRPVHVLNGSFGSFKAVNSFLQVILTGRHLSGWLAYQLWPFTHFSYWLRPNRCMFEWNTWLPNIANTTFEEDKVKWKRSKTFSAIAVREIFVFYRAKSFF